MNPLRPCVTTWQPHFTTTEIPDVVDFSIQIYPDQEYTPTRFAVAAKLNAIVTGITQQQVQVQKLASPRALVIEFISRMLMRINLTCEERIAITNKLFFKNEVSIRMEYSMYMALEQTYKEYLGYLDITERREFVLNMTILNKWMIG